MCLVCESMERHRLYWLYYSLRSAIPNGGVSMLHFAPEMGLEERLSRIGGLRRVTADLFSSFVDLRTDLMFLPFRDASFDVIHCSHVPNTWPTITRGCGNCAASCETTAGR